MYKGIVEDNENEKRHSCSVLQYVYINIIYEITFAKTKTNTKTRWDPSEFCTV